MLWTLLLYRESPPNSASVPKFRTDRSDRSANEPVPLGGGDHVNRTGWRWMHQSTSLTDEWLSFDNGRGERVRLRGRWFMPRSQAAIWTGHRATSGSTADVIGVVMAGHVIVSWPNLGQIRDDPVALARSTLMDHCRSTSSRLAVKTAASPWPTLI